MFGRDRKFNWLSSDFLTCTTSRKRTFSKKVQRTKDCFLGTHPLSSLHSSPDYLLVDNTQLTECKALGVMSIDITESISNGRINKDFVPFEKGVTLVKGA